jgi:nitrite reductase (cytochrome c-552)
MSDESRAPNRRTTMLAVFVLVGSAAALLILGLFGGSILERRAERGIARVQMIHPIAEWESDNAKWGVNFPREYNSWEQTKQMRDNTKYGGSGTKDYLTNDPYLVILFAGFSFSKEYNTPRGHYHAIEDVTRTKRISDKTPATCWTCKSPDVPRLMASKGIAQFYQGKFLELKSEITHPIGCLDCHDPKTMALRISRPALKEAFARQGKDISKATHQEMRSLVCAQCHVSYYFKDKQSNYLIFPWDRGTGVDDFDKYYERDGFSDWTHPISGVKVIKLRHPDYEVWSQGIHAFRNVACADCHMPYRSEGGVKFTDHQVRSPLYNMANSCQVCHRWSEDEIKGRVTSMQDKTRELLIITERAVAEAHLAVGDAAKRGATDAELDDARHTLRRAQMYWDYVAANNGMGFHAPQECARVLAKATNLAQECRLVTERARMKHGATGGFVMPDISTKEKAWAYIKPFVDAQKAKEHAIPPAKAAMR